jgi:hypothetical protein
MEDVEAKRKFRRQCGALGHPVTPWAFKAYTGCKEWISLTLLH